MPTARDRRPLPGILPADDSAEPPRTSTSTLACSDRPRRTHGSDPNCRSPLPACTGSGSGAALALRLLRQALWEVVVEWIC